MFKRPRDTAPAPPMKRRKTRSDKPRIPRTLNDKGIVSIKRKWWVQNWVPGTAATNDFFRNFNFTLSNAPNVTDFQNLFEFYRITGWLIELVPRYDGFNGNDTVDTTLPGITNQNATRVHVNVDPLDTSTPGGVYSSTTLNSFLESGTTKVYSGNKTIKIYIKNPATTDTIGGTTGARSSSPWIVTSQAGVQHWGAKVFIMNNNFSTSFGQDWDIYYTAYMQFKGVQ